MRFEISSRADVQNEEERATLLISGLPGIPETRQLLGGPLRVRYYDIPEGKSFLLKLGVFFPSYQRTVSVSAEVMDVQGIDIVQHSKAFARADVRHGSGSELEQCTVTCPKTGKSATGPRCLHCVHFGWRHGRNLLLSVPRWTSSAHSTFL
jgi:hypothetical protein